MRLQWKRFRRLLWGCTGAAWLLCCAGLVLVEEEFLLVRLGLLVMLVVVTLLSLYLFLVARREVKALDRQAIEIRAAMNQQGRSQFDPRTIS
jgi:hypothetical protein